MNTKQALRLMKPSGVLLCCLLMSGCELLPDITGKAEQKNQQVISPVSYYGGYYLWIKSLSEEELVEEIKHQQTQSDLGDELAEMHLSLLYSLAKSPFHNPYTAKSKLNQQQLHIDSNNLDFTDFSFIVMLKDQLNQQLLALNKLILEQKENTELQKQLDERMQEIKQLEAESMKLKDQILQLKSIEKNINNHG